MNLEQYIQPIVDYVREHQVWAAPIVFVLCFAESLAFISLLIPAWGVLVGLGALISASGLSFWPIVIAGALGAALGDWLSYWVGLKLENRVYHMWPLSQHPNLIPAGEAFIRKWGSAAIFIARFSGPLRASVPIVAGVFAMPYWRFQARQFLFGICLGLGAALARRRHVGDGQVVRRSDRKKLAPVSKTCRQQDLPGHQPGRSVVESEVLPIISPH